MDSTQHNKSAGCHPEPVEGRAQRPDPLYIGDDSSKRNKEHGVSS
jgi:hypothetical protein